MTFYPIKMNKQRFINLLSSILIRNNVEVFHDEADADGLIVTKAIETAASEPTVVIGSDSDLTILLLSNHKVDELEHNLYYQPITRQGTKKSPRLWHINKCRTVLGCEMCDNLKFAHAMLGCDTTSSLYGVGKSSILKSMTSFQTASRIFSNPEASVPSIIEAGECTILKLYSAANGVRSLNDLRLRKFMQKLNHGNFIHPKSLPPTSESASYHSLRVYHQIQAWNNTPLAPTEYGWSIHGTELTPTMTSATIAPDYLLKLIHCGCKGDCSTFKCSCTKVGLECSIACECAGDCLNASKPSDTNDSDD